MYNDTGNQRLYSIFSGVGLGLLLDRVNDIYYLGDYGGTINNNWVAVDDQNQQIYLTTLQLNFANGGIQDNTSRSYTGRNITIFINGNTQYIPIYA